MTKDGSIAKTMVNKDEQKMMVREGDQVFEQREEVKGSAMEGLKRFLKDLTTPKLFVLKMVYFSLLAGTVILWPQFTVHQADLGLTVAHTGIFSSVVAGVGIVVPFVAGVLGDKIGNYKIMLIISTLLTAVAAFLFSVVPSARIPTTNITTPNYTTTTTTTTTPVNGTITDSTLANSSASSSSLGLVDDDLLPFTFWSYLVVRGTYGVLQAVTYLLYEAAVMAEVQTNGVDYGFQRAWGTLAVLGASLLSGYLVELTGGFNILFYLSTALQVVAAALMLLLRLDFKPPATSLTNIILRKVVSAEVIMFFAAMLVAGIFLGFLETFMYRYLSDLGASPVLVGLTVTVGAPFEMVLTLLASFLVPLLGHVPIIIFGLFSHGIRLLGFSFLVDPWWVIALEILESVSNGLLSTVSVMYCTVLFPLESIASFRGIFAVLYFGVGQLVGAASGSWLMEFFGDRGAFRVLAYVAFASSLTYAAAYYCLRRCRRKEEEVGAPLKNDGENQSLPPPVSSDLGTNMEGFDNKAWVEDE